MRLVKAYHIAALVAYPLMVFYVARRAPADEVAFGLWGSCLFFVLYLAPYALFDARMEVSAEGLIVQQFWREVIKYSEIVRCFGVFAAPFQIVVVIARRPFPLCLIITADTLTERRRSMWQDGVTAAAIKRRMGDRSS